MRIRARIISAKIMASPFMSTSSQSSAAVFSQPRSAPEEKLPSAPVRMITRHSGSSLASCQASAMRENIVNVRAL